MLKKLIIFAVLCMFFIAVVVRAQDEDEDVEEKPATTLLVYKHVKDYEAVINTNLTITLTVYNVGDR